MRFMSYWSALLLLSCYCLSVRATEIRLYTEQYRPLSYLENGQLTGMAVTVVEQLIQRTGHRASVQLVPWTRGYYQVQREANSALFSMVRTAAREPLFQWVGPIAIGSTGIYSRRGSGHKLRSLQDVDRLGTLAVPKQWYSYEYLGDQGLKGLYGVPTPQHMVKMFKLRRVELLVASNLALADMLAEQGMTADDVELQFTLMSNNSYIAFSKNTDPALVQQWQQALDALAQDGSLGRIHRRWFGQAYVMPSTDAVPAF